MADASPLKGYGAVFDSCRFEGAKNYSCKLSNESERPLEILAALPMPLKALRLIQWRGECK